jgi:hypothetical protein
MGIIDKMGLMLKDIIGVKAIKNFMITLSQLTLAFFKR